MTPTKIVARFSLQFFVAWLPHEDFSFFFTCHTRIQRVFLEIFSGVAAKNSWNFVEKAYYNNEPMDNFTKNSQKYSLDSSFV